MQDDKISFYMCTILLLLRKSISQFWFHVGVKSDRVSRVVSDSILHQLFIVRFLGSMEVKATESADVIYETMRQILAARAIHNIFRMTESHLLVTCECLKWVTVFVWTDPVSILVIKCVEHHFGVMIWTNPQTKILNSGTKPPILWQWDSRKCDNHVFLKILV